MNRPKRLRLKRTRPGDTGRLRLWPILVVLPLAFVAAVAALAGLAWAARAWLHYPALPHPRALGLHDWTGVLQLVFASVAGAGALVALVVAYRRQRVAEADSAHDRTRVFNERFIAIAGQLGDRRPAVRLAGVHAMAGLADDWVEHRQTCLDVLCAYLRMPYAPDPGEDAATTERMAFAADKEVRHTVIRVITAHLRAGGPVPWQGLDFDFTGVRFDGGDFSGAKFIAGRVSFDGAEFAGGQVSFDGGRFSGGQVSFNGGRFSGGQVSFNGAEFASGQVSFDGAGFSRRWVSFGGAVFSGGRVIFNNSFVYGGRVGFYNASFRGGEVSFRGARFTSGQVGFDGAEFSGGHVSFHRAAFAGGEVSFIGARLVGGEVDIGQPEDWSHPPTFDFTSSPPAGLELPADYATGLSHPGRGDRPSRLVPGRRVPLPDGVERGHRPAAPGGHP